MDLVPGKGKTSAFHYLYYSKVDRLIRVTVVEGVGVRVREDTYYIFARTLIDFVLITQFCIRVPGKRGHLTSKWTVDGADVEPRMVEERVVGVRL